MSLQSIKSEICQLLSLVSISANEAKKLDAAKDIVSCNWSKTGTWQLLLDNLLHNQESFVLPLESAVTNETIDNNESITEQVKTIVEHSSNKSAIVISPVYKAESFIDFCLANKLYWYQTYKVNNIKFQGGTRVRLYSALLDTFFLLKKENKKYTLSFKGVFKDFESSYDLLQFDWLKLSNYYYDVVEKQLITESNISNYAEENIEYRSIKVTNEVDKTTHKLLRIANFRQQVSDNYSSKNIKTFKDWLRSMYLDVPAKYLIELNKYSTSHTVFEDGLSRNYSRQKIDVIKQELLKNPVNQITGKTLNKNSQIGSKATFYDPHLNIKNEYIPTRDVKLSRVQDRYTPVVDSFFRIKINDLFKLLDIELDLSSYLRFPEFIGYWKLVIISHILRRPTFQLNTDWNRIIFSGLKFNGDEFGSYVLVEEIDSKRFNNKIRMNGSSSFKLPVDTSGKAVSKYKENGEIKLIERVSVKHSNMLSSSRSKAEKSTTKGQKAANWLTLATTPKYEIRLFFLPENSVEKPSKHYIDCLSNIVLVDKATSISTSLGQIWIKRSRTGDKFLYFTYDKELRRKVENQSNPNNDVERDLRLYEREIKKCSDRIKQLRDIREDKKKKQYHLINERVITNEQGLATSIVELDKDSAELKALLDKKVSYELKIEAYNLGLDLEVLQSLQELGINVLSQDILPKTDWQRIFSFLKLDIPLTRDKVSVIDE